MSRILIYPDAIIWDGATYRIDSMNNTAKQLITELANQVNAQPDTELTDYIHDITATIDALDSVLSVTNIACEAANAVYETFRNRGYSSEDLAACGARIAEDVAIGVTEDTDTRVKELLRDFRQTQTDIKEELKQWNLST